MRLRAFRRYAERYWHSIPEKFRRDAVLIVHAASEPDPDRPEVFLLGACEPAFAELEDALAASGDPRPAERQHIIHLWYGSFRALGARARDFDWIEQLEETIDHELTHHLEQRAGLDGLDRFDVAQIVNFRRLQGDVVPLGYWRDGESDGPHRWVIDGDVFVELEEAPPWTFEPRDGEGVLTGVIPDPEDGFATIPERGGWIDGERGDLVLAPRPPPPWWRRLLGRFRRR